MAKNGELLGMTLITGFVGRRTVGGFFLYPVKEMLSHFPVFGIREIPNWKSTAVIFPSASLLLM